MIDLRSDTVTRPGPGMRAAMAAAEVGDDVYGDDPGVNALQDYAAGLFGMEAALFAPSGTQTNLIALLTHCQRGDEYIVGREAHVFRHEGGGAAVLGGMSVQPLNNQADGSLALSDIEAAINPDDVHFARSRLLALENTLNGMVLPPGYMKAATTLARQHHLATHLDGARICNAAIKQGLPLAAMAQGFDSLSVGLCKGLGAPVGSLLLGSRAFIKEAVRWRKMLGGGMRQAGIIAAGGLYALQNNIERLAQDHEHAQLLADGLAEIEELRVNPPQTNILFLDVPPRRAQALGEYLHARGVLASVGPRTRLVTHLDVSREDVLRVVDCCKQFFALR